MKQSSDNKRIAKNTVFLYVRMLLVMCITIYTSRVILNALGASDYGVYNVVGGIVTMFSFLTGSMAGATSRFLTFELGTGNKDKLDATFSASLNLYLMVGILVVILGEIVGLYFVNYKLTIPAERMNAAFYILHFSIITAFFTFTQFPYTASIIAHEQMGIYAYVGIYEAVSKLLIAWFITISPTDKLIFYAALIMLNQVLITIFYRLYCLKKFEECRFRIVKDWSLYKKILGYTGYDMMPSFAMVVQNQGVNILLNMFFGPVVNAARAIAQQIDGALLQFVNNYLQAVRPQVIKRYATGEKESMYQLTFSASKYSYLIMLALLLPVIMEIDYILSIWLGDVVPDRTALFCYIILIMGTISPLSSSMWMVVQAIGKLRNFSLVNTLLYLLPLPIGYLFFRDGMPDYTILLAVLVGTFLRYVYSFIQLYLIERYDMLNYLLTVFGRCLVITILSFATVLFMKSHIETGFLRLVCVLLMSEISIIIFTWTLGMSSGERSKVKQTIYRKFKKTLFSNGIQNSAIQS